MVACIQRVLSAAVDIDANRISSINKGLLVFIAMEQGDSVDEIKKISQKIVALRIFSDDRDKMSLSVKDINGEILLVSQFTLAGNITNGNRPDFGNAAPSAEAKPLYELMITETKALLSDNKVKTGIFAADMRVSLVNDGPVTILIKR